MPRGTVFRFLSGWLCSAADECVSGDACHVYAVVSQHAVALAGMHPQCLSLW